MKKRHHLYPVALAGLLALAPGTANAGLVTIDDFEGLNLGDVHGQNGWIVAGATGTTAEVVEGGLSYANGEVNISGGSRSLKIDASSDDDNDPPTDAAGTLDPRNQHR